MTTSACSQATYRGSNGSRCTCVGVSGVRPAAGHQGSQDDDGDRQTASTQASARSSRRTTTWRGPEGSPDRCHRAKAAAMMPTDSSRWAPTTSGLRPVSTDRPPSAACPKMPATTKRGQRHESPATRFVAPHRQDGRHQRGTGDGDQREGQGAVAELDELVEALRLVAQRHQAAAGALRPLRAPESGTGQPHQSAADDDHHLGHEVGQQDPSGPGRQRWRHRDPRVTWRRYRAVVGCPHGHGAQGSHRGGGVTPSGRYVR